MKQTSIVHREADSPEARGVAISRRSFIEVAVGTLAALPVVNGGLALSFGPEKAHAIETTIVTVNPDEAAFLVMDMADDKQIPVGGARVVLKSCFNNKTVEGTTNDKGGVVFNIADLAEDAGKKKKPVKYEFYAEIEVTKEGYRTFRTGRTKVEGAQGIAAPTRKLEPGVPYPSRVTFDNWDALYTDNEFCITALNKAEHTLRIDLENLPETGPVTVSLFADDREIISVAAGVSNGSCTASFMDRFLLKTSEKVLVKGAKYWIRYIQDGQEYRTPISLKVCAAVGGHEAPGFEKNFFLSPFSESSGSTGHKGVQVTFPAGFPFLGGEKVQIPQIIQFDNVDYGFDPFGYFYISYKMTDFGYKSENGEVQKPNAEGGNWQFHPKKSMKDQLKDLWGKHKDSWKDAMSAYGETSLFKPKNVSYMQKFDLSVLAQISLVAKWDEESDLIRLRFGGQVGGIFNFSLSWQFIAVYIPIVIQFSFEASFIVGLNIAASTPKLTDFNQWAIDWVNTGALTYTIDISPSLSIGIGIMDCLTVSLKGVYTITIFYMDSAFDQPRPVKETNKHVVIGMAWSTSIVIQILFVSIPFKLPWSWNEPQFFDSWRKDNSATPQSLEAQAAEAEQAAKDLANLPFLQLINDALDSGEAHQLTEADFAEIAEDECFEIDLDSFKDQSDYSFFELDDVTITGTDTTVEKDGIFGYGLESDSGLHTHAVSGGSGLAAGSSPALAPQASDDAPSSLDDAIIEPLIEESNLFFCNNPAVAKAGVASLGSRTGVVPNVTDILSVNCYGDPHAQVHTIFGRQFVFRIGIMHYSTKGKSGARVYNRGHFSIGDPRSRIICEGSFDDKSKCMFVLDFSPNRIETGSAPRIDVGHEKYDDYDFDMLVQNGVKINPDDDYVLLHFFIISGRRDTGDDADKTRLAYLGRDQLLSYVEFRLDRKTKRCQLISQKTFSADATYQGRRVFDAAQGGDKFPFHHYMSPQITLMEDKADGFEQAGLMFSYLDRAAVGKRENILSQDDDKVRIGAGFFYYTFRNGVIDFSKNDEINQVVFREELKDCSVYQMRVLPRCGNAPEGGAGWYIVMLKGAYTYYFLMEAGAMACFTKEDHHIASGCRQPSFFGVYDRDMENSGDPLDSLSDENMCFGPAQLIPWPKHEGYLASVRGKLMHVKLENLVRPKGMPADQSVPKPRFTFTEIGPQKFNVVSFGVDDDGQFIYYPAVREGVPAYRYDENGKGTAKKKIEEHYVMACKLRGGKFSDPFVFCQVNYDMDTLVACGTQKSVAMSFISSNLKDPKISKAEIRYTAVPHVRCANVIGFSSIGDYAYPGIASPFNVMIRNDGNVYLSGCSIRLHKRGAKDNRDDTLTKIVFSKDTLQESSFNPKKSDGTLDDVEPDYALAPGKTSIYSVMLMVPKNWSGKVNASVTAQDFVAASSSAAKTVKDMSAAEGAGLSTMADENRVNRDEGVDPEAPADEYALEFDDEYEGIDYDDYDDNIDYVVYADYEDDGPDYDEDGNEYVDYIVQPSDYDDDDFLEYPYDELDVLYSEAVDGDGLSDAPVKVGKSSDKGNGSTSDDDSDKGDSGKDDSGKDDSDKGDSGNGSSSDDGSGKGTRNATQDHAERAESATARTGTTTVKTGDPFGIMGGLLGAAAVAGTAMAAYSARRVANERAAAEKASSIEVSAEESNGDE